MSGSEHNTSAVLGGLLLSTVPASDGDSSGPSVPLLTMNARVLAVLAVDPELPLATVAERLGISERAVRYVMTRLIAAGLAVRTRSGPVYRYQITPETVLTHSDSAQLVAALHSLTLTQTPQTGDSAGGADR